jgi:putative N-acetyltransferase (TIGR04045 family)
VLDAINPYGRRVPSYRSPAIVTQVAAEPWQVEGYYRLRREVFAEEQGLFAADDRDAFDGRALPIVAMSVVLGMPHEVVGVVRIFETSPRQWYGGRLAVSAAYRRHGVVGESLIRVAVCTANARGCDRFLATVQAPVVRYFERHHFAFIEPITVCDKPHALMAAELAAFPPELVYAPLARGAEEAA